MVNNSTNINNTKESLNSDGHQFNQYQQHVQSPLILTEQIKTPRHMTLEIQVLA
jgi:hypothetical protein